MKKFDTSELSFETHILWGEPENINLNEAEDQSADLIVIGATGESGLRHLMMGSAAEKVLRYCKCSLLVVR